MPLNFFSKTISLNVYLSSFALLKPAATVRILNRLLGLIGEICMFGMRPLTALQAVFSRWRFG